HHPRQLVNREGMADMCTLKRELCLTVLLLTLAPTLAFGQIATTEPEAFRIAVPENREKTNSRPLSLAVVRFAAYGVDRTIPLIYVSGGSGAGISAVTGL